MFLLLASSTSYHVCACSDGGGWSYSWQVVQVIMFVLVAMEVTGLTPGKEYKFRVAAVNSEGESEPLVADQTIVAKNPFGEYSYIFLVS